LHQFGLFFVISKLINLHCVVLLTELINSFKNTDTSSGHSDITVVLLRLITGVCVIIFGRYDVSLQVIIPTLGLFNVLYIS
jgi:hypothetical protein